MRRRRGAAADDAAVIESSWLEPERFAVLFDRHAPHIHRYLARRAGRQVADDLVAETFLTAFAKRDRYDLGYSDARPWLYGIATNLIGQHRRDEARRYRIRQGAVAEPEVPDHADRVAAGVTASATRAPAVICATLPYTGDIHGKALGHRLTATPLTVAVVIVVFGLVPIALWLWMARAVGQGRSWVRILSMALFILATLQLIESQGVAQVFCAALTWLSGLAAVWMLWRPASSAFFKSARAARSRSPSQISGP